MRASILLALLPLGCFAASDFSGHWSLDRQLSNLRGLAVAPSGVLMVSREDSTYRCTDGNVSWTLRDDGSETSYQIAGITMTSTAKWDGNALAIRVSASGPQPYTIEDRWELSANDTVLTIARTIHQGAETATGKLVYINRERIVVVEPGTKILLSLINTLNTKHSAEGDRVYLETAFPVTQNGHVIIPKGSYVAGTVTEVKRPGKMKSRGELYLRFDSLTLSNGVTRDFHSRPDSADGRDVDREEGKIRGDADNTGDLGKVAEGAGVGATVGTVAGSAAGHGLAGAGIGAVAGMAAGLAAVLLTRGPDLILPQGTTLEMVLDRELRYDRRELPTP